MYQFAWGDKLKVPLSLSCESCQAFNVNRVIRTKEEIIGRNVRIHKVDDSSLRHLENRCLWGWH